MVEQCSSAAKAGPTRAAEKGTQIFARLQSALCLQQGAVLFQGKKGWHQRIAQLLAFSFHYLMRLPLGIVQRISARGALKLSDVGCNRGQAGVRRCSERSGGDPPA